MVIKRKPQNPELVEYLILYSEKVTGPVSSRAVEYTYIIFILNFTCSLGNPDDQHSQLKSSVNLLPEELETEPV